MTLRTIATDHGPIRIREATLADVGAIKALHEQVYHETVQAFQEIVLSSTHELASDLEHRIRVQVHGHKGAQVLVAETASGALAGYVMARHYNRPFGWIDQEVVGKDFRKYGIGQAFTELVVERAKSLKKASVGLNVSAAGNVAFHQRQGFEIVRERPPNDTHQHGTYVMKLQLREQRRAEEETTDKSR